MVRAAFLICAALSAQADADLMSWLGIQSYSVSWTSVSQVGGEVVQDTHNFRRSGESTQEIRSTIVQDSTGGLRGAKDEVRCVGENCAELLAVLTPPARDTYLRGAVAPFHQEHAAPMAQAAQAAMAQAAHAATMAQAAQAAGAVAAGAVPHEVTDGGVRAKRAAEPMADAEADDQTLRVAAAAFFAAAAFGTLVGVLLARGRKLGARVPQLQTLQQFLLPFGPRSERVRAPTAQDDLRRALVDLGNNAVEAYVFGLYARGLHKAEVAHTNAEARAYVRELCERAVLA